MLNEDDLPQRSAARQPGRPASELLEALPVAVYTTDAEGFITACNDAAVDLWGRRPELGTDRWCGSWRLYGPDRAPMAHDDCPMAVALREDRAINAAEILAERLDGSLVACLAFPTPLHDSRGRVTGAVNTLVDISDHKENEVMAQRLAAIVASSRDAIITKDLDGVITTWNASAERLFGYTAEEAVGRQITMLVPAGRIGEESEILRRIRAGEVVDHFETERMRKDGTLVPISLTISPVRGDDGRIVGASKIARDITDRKESQRRIRALMREVNHRVKNQFAVILSMIRESGKRSADPRQFERRVEDRVMALSRSQNLLVDGDWQGAELASLLLSHVAPFGDADRLVARGPPLLLQPIAVQYLGMAFHELAANSARHGVLRGGKGSIAVEWSVAGGSDGAAFRLTWAEPGRPVLAAGGNGGFGTVVLKRVTPSAIDGTATLEHDVDGLVWTLRAPLAMVEQRRSGPRVEDRIAAGLTA